MQGRGDCPRPALRQNVAPALSACTACTECLHCDIMTHHACAWQVARHCRAVGCAGWAGQGVRQGGRGPHGAAGAGGAKRKGDCPLSASPSFCLGAVHWRGAFAGDAWAAGVQCGVEMRNLLPSAHRTENISCWVLISHVAWV